MMPKTATYTAVRVAATTLILAEGATTSLAVKLYLRQRGYEVYKAGICNALYEVAREENWIISDNGLVRIYHFPTLRLMAQ